MKHQQVMGPESFGCVTISALALFAAYESIVSSSLSRPIKATTAGINMRNHAIRALTGLYIFRLFDHLLFCLSGNSVLCLSV